MISSQAMAGFSFSRSASDVFLPLCVDLPPNIRSSVYSKDSALVVSFQREKKRYRPISRDKVFSACRASTASARRARRSSRATGSSCSATVSLQNHFTLSIEIQKPHGRNRKRLVADEMCPDCPLDLNFECNDGACVCKKGFTRRSEEVDGQTRTECSR